MSVLKWLVTLVCIVGSLTIFAWPADAFEEQGRAVRRPRPPQGRPVRPARVYGPRYRSYNPYLYGSVHYGPYWG
ncbi:MAG: hypothetical protein VYE68_08135, partial [Acidobacteriota bacterium]|nr:hypothetical protein [Acidobacteriota bacterium]